MKTLQAIIKECLFLADAPMRVNDTGII